MMPGRRYTPASIKWIIKNRKLLLLGPMIVLGTGASIFTYSLKDQYRAQTLILVVPQRVPENYVRPAVAETIDQRLQAIQPQIMSQSRLERIITELDLYPEKRGKRGGLEEIVADMRSDINVETIKGDLFRVTYSGTNPYKVMQVTQRLASLFIEENLSDREKAATGTTRFLESQLANTRRQLEEQEAKVQEYRQTHAGELPSQVGANLQVLQNVSFQLQTSEESLSRDRDRRLELERTLSELLHEQSAAQGAATSKPSATTASEMPSRSAAPAENNDGNKDGTKDGQGTGASPTPSTGGGDLASKLAQLQTLQQTLAGLELRLKADHPDVIRTKRLIRDLQASIASMKPPTPAGEEAPPADPAALVRTARLAQVRQQIANLDKEIARKTADQEKLRLQIATLQRRVESEPTRESELIKLTRDYDTLKATYQSLLAKKEESGIAADLERQQVGQQFKTLDPARLPEKPYGPNRELINLAAAGAGLALGVALTILLEIRDQSFRNAVEIVPVLSLPVLASVPAIMTATERRKARRLALAVVTAFVTCVGAGGIVAYRMGFIDMHVLKFW